MESQHYNFSISSRPSLRASSATPGATYEEIAANEPERVVVVDASGSPDEVHARIMEVVNGRLAA